MKPIGGELPIKPLSEKIFFTDSGRSSIRLFIRSGNQNKKFLIPDYLCEIIEKILLLEGISFDYYNIRKDLTIDIDSINSKKFDVLYVINYFGQLSDLSQINLKDKIVIEDYTFFYDFFNEYDFIAWYGFNSFRKISPLCDGSLVKTNMNINQKLIKKKEAAFVRYKYKAKTSKYDYLTKGLGKEDYYIRLFEKGEKILNEQIDISQISSLSIFQFLKYNVVEEQNISRKYYDFLSDQFADCSVVRNPVFYSYFPIVVLKRDELRNYLFSKNIFLPIHWPTNFNKKNPLYKKLISIPIFSVYSFDEIKFIAETIKNFYEKH